MPLLLCVGWGFVAQALTQRLQRSHSGWMIAATSRDDVGLARIAAAGHRAIPFSHLATPDNLQALAADRVALLVSAVPDDDGCPVWRALGPAIGQGHVNLDWMGYLSSTGVYGDHGGAWIDESTLATPQSAEGQRRLIAEKSWLAGCRYASHVFRLPGIYGPGRSALDRVRVPGARVLVKPGQVFSRVHVEDIALALSLSLERPKPGLVVNVVDDLPTAPEIPLDFACGLLGLPLLPREDFAAASVGSKTRRFYGESKRVQNDLAKAVLGWSPQFPTYVEGLTTILAGEREAAGGAHASTSET